MGGPGGLLNNKSVQEELKLTSDQIEKISKHAQEVGARRREEFQKLQDLPEGERREKAQALMRTAREENRKLTQEIFTPEQRRRFEQIEVQVRGTEALNDPEIQEKLKLTGDQKEKIRGINEEARSKFRENMEAAGGDFQSAREKNQAARREAQEKVNALLNDDQKATWKELTGAAFEIRFEPPQPRSERPGGARP